MSFIGAALHVVERSSIVEADRGHRAAAQRRSVSGRVTLAFQANSFAFIITRKRGEFLHHSQRDCAVGETTTKLCPPMKFSHPGFN
jgi:hypothetical protein